MTRLCSLYLHSSLYLQVIGGPRRAHAPCTHVSRSTLNSRGGWVAVTDHHVDCHKNQVELIHLCCKNLQLVPVQTKTFVVGAQNACRLAGMVHFVIWMIRSRRARYESMNCAHWCVPPCCTYSFSIAAYIQRYIQPSTRLQTHPNNKGFPPWYCSGRMSLLPLDSLSFTKHPGPSCSGCTWSPGSGSAPCPD